MSAGPAEHAMSAEPTAPDEPVVPGEVRCGAGLIHLNEGRQRRDVVIVNTGDRPVQVGSHFHLPDVNSALSFDRAATRGFRFDIPSGTSVRFEPGASKRVSIVRIGGTGRIAGLQTRHADRGEER
jgi:urease subunit beta